MATVPLPPHKTNIPVYVDRTLQKQLLELAESQGYGITDYCRRILIFAAEQKAKIQRGTVIFSDASLELKESKSPPPVLPLDPPKRPANYRRK